MGDVPSVCEDPFFPVGGELDSFGGADIFRKELSFGLACSVAAVSAPGVLLLVFGEDRFPEPIFSVGVLLAGFAPEGGVFPTGD